MKQNQQHFKVFGHKKHKIGEILNLEPQASGDVRNKNSFFEQINSKIQL